MPEHLIRVEDSNGVRTVVLDRPDKSNALDVRFAQQLRTAVSFVQRRPAEF